jgi:hypothetical protein
MGEIQNKKGGVFDFSNKWDILYRFSLFNVDNRIIRKTLERIVTFKMKSFYFLATILNGYLT